MLIARRWRAVAAAVVAATSLTAAPPALAADPLPPAANPLGQGAFCDGAPGSNPFTDLGAETTTTRQVILCLVATELTSGTSATRFSPGGTVTRRQVALFIKRTADLFDELETTGLNALPAYDGQPDYTDVAGEDPVFREAIGQLTQAQIVGGRGDGTFQPGAPVSRRQMAAFVNRLQSFLTGTPYTTNGDFFDDDDGDPGEDNLNALAAAGIFQGDGRGNVQPNGLLTRRQMANILLRNAQVQLAAGRIDSPFEEEPPPTGTVNLAPDATATLEFVPGVDSADSPDDRTYTGSSLPASAGGYRVTLFDTDNIATGGGSTRFARQGGTALADAGTVAARIVKVNGTDVAATQSVGGIRPVNGTITVVVDGNGTESVTPVIHVDGGADTRLEVDDQGRPTEAFDLGGATQYIPAQAGDNAPVNGTVSLVGSNFAVVGSGTSAVTVYFRNGDTYRIGSAPPFGTVTPAVFGAALSTGDSLRTCQSNLGLPDFYDRDGANEFCLDDTAPVPPSDVRVTAGTPADTSLRVAWTGVSPADSYNVYRHNRACTNTTVEQLVLVASVPATTTEYLATGLTPETTYCFVVTTVEDGDESAKAVGTGANGDDGSAQRATAGFVDAPRILSAVLTTDAFPEGGAGTGDVITLTFNERMRPGTVAGTTIAVIDADGDTTTISCGTAVTVGDGVTSADCSLGNGADNTVLDDTLTIRLTENGDDANVGGGGNPGVTADPIEYPLTITAMTKLADLDDEQQVDVANSPDRVI